MKVTTLHLFESENARMPSREVIRVDACLGWCYCLTDKPKWVQNKVSFYVRLPTLFLSSNIFLKFLEGKKMIETKVLDEGVLMEMVKGESWRISCFPAKNWSMEKLMQPENDSG